MAHNFYLSTGLMEDTLGTISTTYTTVELVGYLTATPQSEIVIDTKSAVVMYVTESPIPTTILYNDAELKFSVSAGRTVSKLRLKKDATTTITIDFDTTYAFPTLGYMVIPASNAGTSYGISLQIERDWS
ncbi:MAG: hypothetical protein EOM76_09610 [Sphingobacteriia bacterium]|nr:hypothetical protein [Sphingobacteriia bacterium]